MRRASAAVGFPDYVITSLGEVYSVKSGDWLKPFPAGKGHMKVGLYVDGVRKVVSVHRLVLDAFVGPRTELQGCHEDGDKANNKLSNLSWGDNSKNQLDSVRHGTHRSARVTECPKGHPYSGSNLIQTAKQRVCRECGRDAAREYQRAKRLRNGR